MMYGKPPLIHEFAWSLRRRLHASPMQRLFRELGRRGVPLKSLDALEMFGGDGGRHTIDYQPLVHSIEVWEVDGSYEASLRKNLPGGRIKITDSFREFQTTAGTYDLIVIDSPGGLYGPDLQYCEHVEAFTPSLFRIARESAVFILSIFPDLRSAEESPALRERLSRRGSFYGTTHPELLEVSEMVSAYQRIANAAGFRIQWHFSLRRTVRSKVYYLAMNVTRQGSIAGLGHLPSS